MSYILDALRKAESERQSKKSPDLHSLQSQTISRQSDSQSPWRLYVLVVVVAVVASGLMFVALQYGTGSNESLAMTSPDSQGQFNSAAGSSANTNGVTSIQQTSAAVAPTRQDNRPLTQGVPAAKGLQQVSQPLALSQASSSSRALISELKFSFHVYSQEPASRAIIIDGRRMREGESINDELQLHSISKTGVVIAYKESLIKVGILEQW